MLPKRTRGVRFGSKLGVRFGHTEHYFLKGFLDHRVDSR